SFCWPPSSVSTTWSTVGPAAGALGAAATAGASGVAGAVLAGGGAGGLQATTTRARSASERGMAGSIAEVWAKVAGMSVDRLVLARALEFAVVAHGDQTRKGTAI